MYLRAWSHLRVSLIFRLQNLVGIQAHTFKKNKFVYMNKLKQVAI